MDCQQYQDALSAAALGAESGADAQAFRLHLEICEGCRREFARRREFLATLDLQLQAQLEAVPSLDFNARLRRRVASESECAPRPVLSWLPLLAGAAALAALLALLHYRGVMTPHQRDANPVHIASTPGAQPSQAAAADHPSVPVYANSPAASSASVTPFLHPVAATPSTPPALKVRINRQELYATVRFSQALADGRIDATALLSAAKSADESAGAKPLEIPLIEMKPIEEPHADVGPAAH